MLANDGDYDNALKLFESASQADLTEFILPKQNFAAVTQLKEDQIEEDSKK